MGKNMPGGRMSTRFTSGGHQYDHGCQFFKATSPAMKKLVAEWVAAGVVAEWRPKLGVYDASSGVFKRREELSAAELQAAGSGFFDSLSPASGPMYVAKPSMDTLVGSNGGVDPGLPAGELWNLGVFDALLITDSSPGQITFEGGTAALSALVARLAALTRVPLFSLMVGWPPNVAGALLPGDAVHVVGGSAVQWVANDTSKPGRERDDGLTCWVAVTKPEFAAKLIGDIGPLASLPPAGPDYNAKKAQEVWAGMQADLRAAMGIRPLNRPKYLSAHRWGSAFTSTPLGVPAVWEADGRLPPFSTHSTHVHVLAPQPELLEAIAAFLPPNDVAASMRLLSRSCRQLFAGATTIRLSQPVPTHAFAWRWSGPASAARAATMPLARRRQLLTLTASSGVLENYMTAHAAAGCLPDAAAGQRAACELLLRRGAAWSEAAVRGAARGKRDCHAGQLLLAVAAGLDLPALQRLEGTWAAEAEARRAAAARALTSLRATAAAVASTEQAVNAALALTHDRERSQQVEEDRVAATSNAATLTDVARKLAAATVELAEQEEAFYCSRPTVEPALPQVGSASALGTAVAGGSASAPAALQAAEDEDDSDTGSEKDVWGRDAASAAPHPCLEPFKELELDAHTRSYLLQAAAGSPRPDWRDKVEWLEGRGYVPSAEATYRAAHRPDARGGRLAALQLLGTVALEEEWEDGMGGGPVDVADGIWLQPWLLRMGWRLLALAAEGGNMPCFRSGTLWLLRRLLSTDMEFGMAGLGAAAPSGDAQRALPGAVASGCVAAVQLLTAAVEQAALVGTLRLLVELGCPVPDWQRLAAAVALRRRAEVDEDGGRGLAAWMRQVVEGRKQQPGTQQ
eukprot:XP_001700922.1 predicted protein [Chlamydomonas reinhardtii]